MNINGQPISEAQLRRHLCWLVAGQRLREAFGADWPGWPELPFLRVQEIVARELNRGTCVLLLAGIPGAVPNQILQIPPRR